MTARTCIILLLLAATPLAAQWQHVGSPNVERISSVDVVGQRIFAMSERQGSSISDDAGNTWRVQHTLRFIRHLFRVDTLLFAEGIMVLRTTDGGETWQWCENFYGTLRAIARHAGMLFAASVSKGLYVSTDQGLNWQTINTFDEHAYGLHAEDSVLLASDFDTIRRSTNTGLTWRPSLSGQYKCTLHRTSEGLYAGSEDGRIWFTSDLGLTWSERTGTHPVIEITQIIQAGDTLYTTSSMGLHRRIGSDTIWHNVSEPYVCGAVLAHRTQGDRSYIATYDGLLQSTDGGTTWSHLTPFNGTPFTLDLLVVHDTLYLATSTSLHTRSGASAEWQRATHSQVRCASVAFVQRHGDDLWMGADSSLLRSHDNGATWQQVATISGGVLAMHLVGDTVIVGSRDWIRVSTDAGATWTRPPFSGQYEPRMFAVAHHRGMWYAYTKNGGSLHRSTDAGRSWHDIAPDDRSYVILAHDDDTLYAYGGYPTLKASTDGGDSWHEVPLSDIGYVVDLQVANHHLLLLTRTGVHVRVPGTAQWSAALTLPVPDALILRVADGFLWVGTDTSGIWRYPLANILGVAPADARIPSDITIVGLSPHPVHGELMVEFETRNSGSVELDVWDALGRHVLGKRLVLAARARHREHVTLPPTSSGIHLLRLRTAHGAATRTFLVR